MKWNYCEKHYNEYDADEGCEYCYEVYKLISEFVENLKDLPDSKWTRRHIRKWEEKLK